MALTIEELVRAPSLGLNLVAGKRNAARQIVSVQTCDLDDPLSWMSSGTLLLRTEWGTESISERESRLVAELNDGGIAGLGVGVFALGTSPCERLIEVADEVGLPLLTVPPRTSFQQVSAHVVAYNASAETYRLRRTVSLHDLLLTRFEDGGIDGVMEAACSVLGMRIFLLGEGGEVQGAWPGTPPSAAQSQENQELWQAYVTAAPSDGDGVVATSEGTVHYAEIRCGEEWRGVLICLGVSRALGTELDVSAMGYLKRLVQLYQAGASVDRRRQRESREALLAQLAAGQVPAHRLRVALERHSVSYRDPLVAVLLHPYSTRTRLTYGVLDIAQWRKDVATVVLSAASDFLERRCVPFLSGWWEGVVAVILPSVPATSEADTSDVLCVVRDLTEHLEASIASLELSAGISDPVDPAQGMPTAFSHALQALQRAGSRDGHGRVVLYRDLGVEQEVLDALPTELLERLRARVTGPLSRDDPGQTERLIEVLSTYLEHNGSVTTTAATLFMHRNTLRRRIARIEEELGVDLTVFRDLTEVRLGLRANEVLRSRAGGVEPTDVMRPADRPPAS